MEKFWGILMVLAGVLLFLGGRTKSDFAIYRLLVERSKMLWGEKVYLFHQIAGGLIILFGSLMFLGIFKG